VELKSEVRSLIVVMVDVLVQYIFEVAAATNDQPVQAFASSTWKPLKSSSSTLLGSWAMRGRATS